MVTFPQTDNQIKTGHMIVASSVNVIDLINMQIRIVSQGLHKWKILRIHFQTHDKLLTAWDKITHV